MVKQINLHLYEGNGVPINKRNQTLPDFEPLYELEDPKNYIAEKGLKNAVNVALALGQPLLITGEPGTGKTQLASSIAYELGLPILKFFTKTTSTATDLFYQYDALRRFQDSQASERKNLNIEDYITYQALGKAILLSNRPEKAEKYLPKNLLEICPIRSVVLIDEIDKAPRDFPNDVLNELEYMEFTVKETGAIFKAEKKYQPILVLTSNSEKNLPDAFLRRCVFYHIPFPSPELLKQIVQRRFNRHPNFTPEFIDWAIEHFFEIREWARKKKPATAEFLGWIRILQSLELDLNDLKKGEPEALALSYSILAKTQEDLAHLKDKLSKNI